MPHVGLILAHLRAHAEAASVPLAAREAAAKFVLDSIGVALSGASVNESAMVKRTAMLWGQGHDARIWGSDVYLPAPSAAMVNAFHVHNQEFDCVHEKAVVHPMAVILAAITAWCERAGRVSGQRYLAAIALAVDVATVIGMSATKPIRFFRPAQAGCLGAAAGLAWLARLDDEGVKNTLGLAYSQLAGTMQAHVEGTPALALQVAFAARAAVCAADLATTGFRGPHDVFDGKYGYFALIEDGVASPEAPFAELGRVWQIMRVSHKPYPTGRAAQGGISGLLSVMAEEGITKAAIAKVRLEAPPLIRQLVDRPYVHHMPVNYARLCLPYLLALAMRDGRVDLSAYTTANLGDATLAALAAKIDIVADANPDVNALVPQRLIVTTMDGRSVAREMPHVYGAPEAPMLPAAQHDKFVACCRAAPMPLDDAGVVRLVQTLHNIEALDDIKTIIDHTIRS